MLVAVGAALSSFTANELVKLGRGGQLALPASTAEPA
jgi:hypothetical protein